MACLSDNDVAAAVQGRLSPEQREALDEHLAGCEVCRILIAETLKYHEERPVSPDVGGEDKQENAGARARYISRYRIERTLGSGAIGTVYEAFDPQLKRAVALKLLQRKPQARPRTPGSEEDDSHSARLLREAEVMARLSHPNVVQVYDSGRVDGQAFVAMELIRGQTLARWLASEPRTRDEILRMFIEAARGLSATHAAGIVHGDFKPENVLVSADGRASVTDFGLARGAGPASAGNEISGTPIYMSPEQLRGAEVDARSDQFSFCVAVFVALYGVHPFGDKALGHLTLFGLASRVFSGRVRAQPVRDDVPRSIFDALTTGMNLRPERRHASMDALVDALGSGRVDPARISHRTFRGSGAVLAVACVGVVLGAWYVRRALAPAAALCGNAVVENGEPCDDGNRADTDGCLSTCRFARCGDGFVRAHIEECDDGNSIDGDGCSRRCARPCAGGNAAMMLPEVRPAEVEELGCYERHDTPETWEGALHACWARDSFLVTYGSEEEASAITAGLFAGATAPVWIGLRRAGNGFAWVTGISRYFHAWETGQPDEVPGHDCVVSMRGAFGWRAAPCGERHGYVCERDPWGFLNPKTNHAYKGISAPLTWDESRRACEQRGGHLATVVDSEEQVFLSKQQARLSLYWLGGTNRGTEHRPRWITDEPTNFTYYDESNGPPRAGDPDLADACLAMDIGGYWQRLPCNERHPFLCEID